MGIATVKQIEASSEIRGAASTLWRIQNALEDAEIKFMAAEEGEGVGVRLRHHRTAKSK